MEEKEGIQYTEINKAEALIKELFPDFKFLKGNSYSIIFFHDAERITIARQASTWFRIKSTLKIPFVFIPLCFKYGYITIKKTIWEVYHGKWAVSASYDKSHYDIVKQYIQDNGLDEV